MVTTSEFRQQRATMLRADLCKVTAARSKHRWRKNDSSQQILLPGFACPHNVVSSGCWRTLYEQANLALLLDERVACTEARDISCTIGIHFIQNNNSCETRFVFLLSACVLCVLLGLCEAPMRDTSLKKKELRERELAADIVPHRILERHPPRVPPSEQSRCDE